MFTTGYYVIRPLPALQELLDGVPPEDVYDELREDVLWSHRQGGRSVLTLSDHTALVKRMFVAHVRYLLLGDIDPPEPLKELPLDEATFDGWWSIEAFDGEDSSTEEVASDLRMLDRPELSDLLRSFP